MADPAFRGAYRRGHRADAGPGVHGLRGHLACSGFCCHTNEAELPLYQASFSALYQQLGVFLGAHGVRLESLFPAKAPTSERIVEFTRTNFPTMAGLQDASNSG